MRKLKPHNPRFQTGHPLARGLVGFWAFEKWLARDLLGKGQDGPSLMEVTTAGMTEYGRCAHVASDDLFKCTPGSALPSDVSLNHHTWEFIGVPSSSGTQSYGSFFAWGGGGSGGGDEFLFGVDFSASTLRIYADSAVPPVPAITLDEPLHALVTVQGSDWNVYINGEWVEYASHAAPIFDQIGDLGYDDGKDNRYFLGDDRGGSVGEDWYGEAVLARVWDRVLSPREIMDLYIDPWGLARPTRSRVFAVPVVGGVTGTSAITLPAPTSAASGDIKHTGTSAITLPVPTSSASGVASTPISGSSAITLPLPTSSASGVVGGNVSGTSVITLPLPTSAASGISKHVGTSVIILPVPVSAATGAISGVVAGSSATVLPLPVSAALGVAKHVGTSVVILPLPISSASGVAATLIFGTSAIVLPLPLSTAAGGGGIAQILPVLLGLAQSVLSNLSGAAVSVETALLGSGTSVLPTLQGGSLMLEDQHFEMTRGADIAQPFTVTLDQLRTLDGTETWSWTVRRHKGDTGGVLLTMAIGSGITIDGTSKQPTVTLVPADTPTSSFPNSDREVDYWHQLTMTKSGKTEPVLQGRLTMIGDV